MDILQQLYNEWRSLMPLKPEDEKRLNRKFMLEFNYNSNHLEGNTLTYGQTKLLFMFGETSGSASLKDYEEMKAHNVGLEMLKQEALDKERPLTEQFIRELNKTILVQNYWKEAKTPTGVRTRMEIKVSVYKSRPNSVITATGEEFQYASPEETPAFMTELVRWLNEEGEKGVLSPIELAALLHYRFIRIHPFEDGNGRIARLLVNYILYRNGYPMIVIHTEDKQNYLRVLHQCDVEVGLTPSDGANAQLDKIRPFVEYLKACAEKALRTGIKAAKGESIEEDDDFEKELTVLQRQVRRSKLNAETPQFGTDVFRHIFEKVYQPFVQKLDKTIQASGFFFSSVSQYGFLSLTTNDRISVDDPSFRSVDWGTLSNARSLVYSIEMSKPKDEYNLYPVIIKIEWEIVFKSVYYYFSSDPDAYYPNGILPPEEDLNKIMQDIKKDILAKIKRAAKV